MGKTRKFDSLIIIIIMVMVNGEHKNILSIMAFAMDHCIKIHSNNNGRKTQLSNFNKISVKFQTQSSPSRIFFANRIY